MTECSICTEKYNKSSRKCVVCPHCAHESCTKCNETVFLDSVNEPHCMSCRKVWSIDVVTKYFTKTFITGKYRSNREEVYFKQEEGHFPALLAVAERQKRLDALEDEFNDIETKINENDKNEDQLVRQQREIHRKLKLEMHKNRTEFYREHGKVVRKEAREVVMKCPMDNCRGFLNSEYYCGLCQSHICNDCHVKKQQKDDVEHKCNPDEVATVTELRRSTRSCPNAACGVPIFKTEGCDQMWCVKCHTAFSWRTGQIETGVIHNPEYFAALRRGNINHERHQPHQGGCGPMRVYQEIRRVIRPFPPHIADQLTVCYQQIAHHRNVTLPMFTRVPDRTAERVDFMIGKIPEHKFKHALYVHKQKMQRCLEEQQVINTYVTIGEDLFRSLTEDNLMESLEQLTMLRDVSYDAIVKIDKKYQHKGFVLPKDIRDYNVAARLV